MKTPALAQHLGVYQQWKTRLARAVSELEHWLNEHRRATPWAREQIQAALDAIQHDRLTLAFVGERSRGSSELINAIFFPDFAGRLLPAAVGRTTRCPTEILWDVGCNEAYLRLLPMETRAEETSIADLKSDARHWVHYPLSVEVPEQTASTLKEILQTKTVSMAEATRLGLSSAGLGPDGHPAAGDVEIPKWRHAIISLPHPLLRQGLVLLDTPGSEALGAEPELTTSLLPAVQAVLFVIAADTGVTRGDLEIWQHHLKGFQSNRQRAMLVVLNKMDVLWDERRERAANDALAASQRRKTAEVLGLDLDSVFPVSAQKGLVAKLRKDEALLRRSGLPLLERHLAARMLATKQSHLIEVVNAAIAPVLDRNRTRVASHMARVKTELEELERLRDQSQDVIARLLEKTRGEQERYLKGVQKYQRSREELVAETNEARRTLEREAIDTLIEGAHQELLHSWTSLGLTRAMNHLFDELRRVIQTVATDSERIRKLVRETYQSFRDDFQLEAPMPKVFALMNYRVEIELLFQEVEVFRRSPGTFLAYRGAVIRRFHEQMVSRARVLFDQLREAFDGWIRESLEPLAEEIQRHKGMMETRLENLQRIGRSDAALHQRMESVQGQFVGFARELTALRNIHNALQHDPLAERETPSRLRLVSARAGKTAPPG